MTLKPKASKAAQLDDTDRKLLGLLKTDGQTKYAELGKQLNLSAPAVHERVQKLRRAGILLRYTVDLEPSSLGFGICAFVNVYLGRTACFEIAPLLERFPEIEECHSVAGEQCLILKVRTESPEALGAVLTAIRKVRGINRTTTSLVLGTYFARGTRTC